MNSSSYAKTAAITGLSLHCSLGDLSADVWKGIVDQRTGLDEEEYFFQGVSTGKYFKHVADRRINLAEYGIDKQLIQEMRVWKGQKESIDLMCLLKMIQMAIKDSNISDTKDLGLVVAHENIGLEEFCWNLMNFKIENDVGDSIKNFSKFVKEYTREVYELQSFMSLYHIAKIFDIRTQSIFINNACSSGLYALEQAKNIINSGHASRVIVAASDFQSVFKMQWLKESGLYAEDGAIMPFDKRRKGFVSGEGGAAIVVEDLDTAIARGAHIYGLYLGGAFLLDCWKVTMPNVLHSTLRTCMESALKRVNKVASDIDMVCTHGVGTIVSDNYEASALMEVFQMTDKPICCGFKPYVGHNLGGSSLLELVLAFISLENKQLPPLLNTSRNHCEFDLKFPERIIPYTGNTFMKICNAFGGYCSAAIFERY